MNGSLQFYALSVAAAVLVGAAPALAADFSITVPLQMTNLPAGSFAYVACYATDDGAEVVGEGSTRVPDAVGPHPDDPKSKGEDFTGTVTVEFDANEGIHPDFAAAFVCSLQFRDRNEIAAHVAVSGEGQTRVLSWQSCIDSGYDPLEHPFECGGRDKTVVGVVDGFF